MVGGAGLTNVLSGTANLDDVLQPYGDEGLLTVIAAGPTPPNPGELLPSSNISSLLDKLRARNDFVLVDAAPLLPSQTRPAWRSTRTAPSWRCGTGRPAGTNWSRR